MMPSSSGAARKISRSEESSIVGEVETAAEVDLTGAERVATRENITGLEFIKKKATFVLSQKDFYRILSAFKKYLLTEYRFTLQ